MTGYAIYRNDKIRIFNVINMKQIIRTGIFLLMIYGLLGTSLVFEFNLGPQRKPVQGSGEVVWVRERYLGPGQPAGIGIRFSQLDAQSRDHIAEALFEFLERSLAEDSYLDPERLVAGVSLATRQAHMMFLRDRIIEAGRCGGLDLGWR